jgi:hypothetical protein
MRMMMTPALKVNMPKQPSLLIVLIVAMTLPGCGGVGIDTPGLKYQTPRM